MAIKTQVILNKEIHTKYGDITPEEFSKYKKSIVGRIYAILPMKEENVPTVQDYIESLNRELIHNLEVFDHCERVFSVVCLLEYLITEENHDLYRKEVLHCCDIMSKVGDTDV